MKTYPTSDTLRVLGLLAACFAFTAQGQQPAYHVIDIPPTRLTGLAISTPADINNKNEIVGTADMESGQKRAFLYSGGVFKDLGALGGVWSRGFAINDAGQIVGGADLANNTEHAFLYSKGVMKDLGTLGGTESYAADINGAGVIVGQGDLVGAQGHQAFIYKSGKMTALGTLGGLYSHATSINDAGKVTGASTTTVGSGTATGFFYNGSGAIQTIGYLPNGNSSSGFFIGTNGIVWGVANRASAQGSSSFAISWGSNTMTDLFANDATLEASVARQVNRSGKMVGKIRKPGIGDHGFVANPSGPPVELNTLVDPDEGWNIIDAYAINDAGVIAAYGNRAGISFGHALLLMPSGGAPISLTGNASGITNRAATLNGEVIGNGFDTQVWFQFGTTTSYGQKTAMQPLTSAARTAFQATLFNLKPHTVYHYRVAAKNSKGTVYGGDNTFTTTNTDPVARNDLFFVNSTKATAVNVLANDDDADGDIVRFAYPFSAGNFGTAKNSGKNIVYTPGEDFTGLDTLQYWIVDGASGVGDTLVYVMNSAFDGLLNSEGQVTGLITVNLAGQGTLTAKVRIGTQVYSFTGALDGDRTYTRTVTPRGLPPATLGLVLDPMTGTMTGTVDNGGASAHTFTLANALTVAGATGNRKLTAFMPPQVNPLPAGFGHGTISVAANGAITAAGKMGDGTPWSASARLRSDGMWNLMSDLVYPGSVKGYLVGNLIFSNDTDSDCSGTLRWVKPLVTTGTYNLPAFDTLVDFRGAFYTAPPVNTPVLTFGAGTSVTLSEGNLASDIIHALTVSNKNVVTVTAPGVDKLALSIAASTGVMSGSFLHPLKGKTPVKVYGVIYQKQNLGARGMFMGTTTSGTVMMVP